MAALSPTAVVPLPAFEISPLLAEVRADDVTSASRQLRALAALSGSLTDPLTPAAAADVIERHALGVLGATSAVVVTLGQFPPNDTADPAANPAPTQGLILVRAIGVSSHLDASLRYLWLDASAPLAEVARTGQPLFLGSESELRRYPGWGDATVGAGAVCAAGVPVWANGQLRGVLGLTWTTPHVFDEDERAFVLTLGVMCAQAIMRGHLSAAERDARAAAEQANRSKTQLLRMISHELRTPMTAVLGYIELLAAEVSGPVTQAQKEHLRRVHRSSEHLLSLIEELLHFARLEAGEEMVNLERVRAIDVVEQTIDIVSPIAELKGVRIRFDRPDEPIELETDPLKLRQILVNLVSNAVKYTDFGDVVLILRIEGLGVEMKIFFEVSDSGCGIAAADHEHVFEAFWRADKDMSRPSKGTGLGLSVGRQLAQLLGGDVIIAKSELGVGSTFIALIPARYQGKALECAASGASTR
ncbi:MAG TPA: HAMP domain-containing sensor histidine kinase [Gemmatimonadaceae bacterium]|jgi:signal transduction histidine kinase